MQAERPAFKLFGRRGFGPEWDPQGFGLSALSERLISLVQRELAAVEAAELQRDLPAAWIALERAHVAAQPRAGLHTRVHLRMVRLAWLDRDVLEFVAQIATVPLAPLVSAVGVYRVAGGRLHRSQLDAASVPEDILAAIGR